MKKELREMFDGAEPEEIKGFEKEITADGGLPEGVSAERIAEKAKAKAGIASSKMAKVISPDRKTGRKKMSKKGRAWLLAAACLVMALLTAGSVIIVTDRIKKDPVNIIPSEDTGYLNSGKYNDGVIGENKSAARDGGTLFDRIAGVFGSKEAGVFDGAGKSYEMEASPSAVAPEEYYEDVVGEPAWTDCPGGNTQMRAGTLTAGEWRDSAEANIAEWRSKLNGGEWYSYAKARKIFAGNVVPVSVTYNGNPVFNCRAELLAGDNVVFTGVTDISGRAILLWGIDGEGQTPTAVRVGGKTVALEKTDGSTVSIEAEAAGIAVTELDLMLMIDTTGSMGDELEYLKAELTDMIGRIAEAGSGSLSIRVSVNFYRDEGDEYVVKYFDFRTDIAECQKQIDSQYASGGGDYPEAVHTALENAVTGHQWREKAVKLCFFVLDAPPHEGEKINSSLRSSIITAAATGIRIIPVASSGVDQDFEILFRSFAVMTGGTYVFLTDHSGIGGSHKEAEVGEFDVEPLNECLIRITCEYCGLAYTRPAAEQQQ